MSEINPIEQWSDMYNEKDKKHFIDQLKLAKAEQKLERIKEIVINEYSNGNFKGKEVVKILQIIDRRSES